MARTKKNPPLHAVPKPAIHTVTLAPDVVETLRRVSGAASDFLGRRVSSSAIIRGLARQIGKQGPDAMRALFLEVERELDGGVRWGSKGGKR